MRTPSLTIVLVGLMLVGAGVLLPGRAAPQEAEKKPAADKADEPKTKERAYTRMVASPVMTAGGAEFRAETEDLWATRSLSHYPVDVRLRITNRSDKPLVFPFFDTFELVLYNPDGTKHRLDGGRNGTRPVMSPLVLEAGQDYSIVRPAQLRWEGERKELILFYEDGTGSIFRSGHLAEEKHALSFRYRVEKKWADTFSKMRPPLAVWEGEIETKPVAFEVSHKGQAFLKVSGDASGEGDR